MRMSSNQAEQACGAIIQSVLKLPGQTGLGRGEFQQVDRIIVLREQARSHRDFQRTQNLRSAGINNVGASLLAMAVGQAVPLACCSRCNCKAGSICNAAASSSR
jgi:hypothetical protein